MLDAVWVHNNCGTAFTVGAEDLAQRATEILNLAKNAFTRRTTTVAVAVGKNEAGEIMTAVGSSERVLRDEQQIGLLLFEKPIDGTAGIHAEIDAIQYLQSKGFSQIIAVGASRNFCNDCVNQLLSLGLQLP